MKISHLTRRIDALIADLTAAKNDAVDIGKSKEAETFLRIAKEGVTRLHDDVMYSL